MKTVASDRVGFTNRAAFQLLQFDDRIQQQSGCFLFISPVVRNLGLPALASAAVRLHTDSALQRCQSTWCRPIPNAAPVCLWQQWKIPTLPEELLCRAFFSVKCSAAVCLVSLLYRELIRLTN